MILLFVARGGAIIAPSFYSAPPLRGASAKSFANITFEKPSVFHHIEFLRLGDRRVLVILVSPDGDVQNRVIFTAQDYSQSELAEASNRLNAGYVGLTLEAVRERLRHEVDALRGEIAQLMSAAVDVGTEAMGKEEERVIVSGERNLLTVQDFSNDMGSLRRLFDLFEQKTQLMRLLDTSSRAEGVRIYIGGESQVVPYEELSIVSAPYEVDGQVVGGAAVAFNTNGVFMLEGRSDLAVLWDLRVHPAWQRQGVGRALFQHAAAWARARRSSPSGRPVPQVRAGTHRHRSRPHRDGWRLVCRSAADCAGRREATSNACTTRAGAASGPSATRRQRCRLPAGGGRA